MREEWGYSIYSPSFSPARSPCCMCPSTENHSSFSGFFQAYGWQLLPTVTSPGVLHCPLLVSLNPDHAFIKRPCIKLASNYLVWPCCLFAPGSRWICWRMSCFLFWALPLITWIPSGNWNSYLGLRFLIYKMKWDETEGPFQIAYSWIESNFISKISSTT